MIEKPIKILHIYPNWEVIYIHIENGVTMKSIVPLGSAIFMLNNIKFDLVLSEPQNMAIVTPQTQADELDHLADR